MDVIYLALCIFVFTGIVNGQYYFVTSPNVIRFEHEETVTVSVFGLVNTRVKIWLQRGEKKFSEKVVVVPNEKTPVNTTILVTENDVFHHTVMKDKPRTLRIFSEWQGATQSREVILSYRSGYLIVQTDKPIYTPQQKVRIRTLALKESLKPFVKQEIAMEIISPTNLTMARISIKESPNGFFKNVFDLPPYPDLGIWTARAFIKGQFETSATSQFQVDEYVLPTFGVTADVNVSFIGKNTTSIRVTVRAKYVYGKPVDGTARLTLNLTEKSGKTEFILGLKPAHLQHDNGVDGSVKEFNINSSALLQGRAFPEGCRLKVIATVYESATGKEEAVSNDDVMFVENPYRFHFTRSKINFRPGWEYVLKVDVTYANGKPVDTIDVNITCIKGDEITHQIKKTDSKGRAIAWFDTSSNDKLEFNVFTVGESQYSEKFQVAAYESENQIQVEQKIDSNTMTMQAHTNMKSTGYTGMLFMVITRGKVVHTSFTDPANQKTKEIEQELQEYITPSARLLVFYVDKSDHEVVADSVKFEVEEKCRGDGKLTLETLNKQVKPGDRDQLIVTGSPFMWVGLNVIDKALLLLNDKNVLRKHKMFEILASHDLGCGEGSGKSSGDVFKKSGLTVLTNADLSSNDLTRSSEDCASIKRRKRDADDCFGAEHICCMQGKELGERLFNETTEKPRLDPYTKCYAYARKLALQRKLLTKCIMAFFLTCKDTLETSITDLTKLASKSLLDDENYYIKDLERLADEDIRPATRKDFRESWLFDEVQLDNGGENKIYIDYPDSITEWMFQAIGITEDRGMCIAEALDVRAYRPFFIQLHLPYKAVRLEYIDVKATIFSYGLPIDNNRTANVYVEGVEGLCFSSEPNKPSPKISVILPPNSAQTVTFPMTPMRDGTFPIKVSAMVTEGGLPMVDVVEKKLYVVNEGIEVKISIQVCLDPNNDMEDCKNDPRVLNDEFFKGAVAERILTVDLSLQNDSISGTGAATGYIQSNIMDNIVTTILEGVDRLFGKPWGCGEQTIATTSPNVYAMMYLKQTKQITKEIEEKGNYNIRFGINREISQFRHSDGSYSCCLEVPTSTWLTAFVAKVFCQAKTVVDDAINTIEDIEGTINWLINHVQSDGSFVENMPVGWRVMVGRMNEKTHSLTSFVLVSLLECPIRTQAVNNTIQKSKIFLENTDRNVLRNDPYQLALTTYALAMANSGQKWAFKTLLEEVAHKKDKDMYWGHAGGQPASSESVEITAYALLAMLQFNDLGTSARIVRWLTAQRDARGIFRSTQDTAVGLQALSTYSIRTYSPDVNLEISLLGGQKLDQFSITKENAIVQRIAKNLPVERGDNTLTVRVKGSGAGRMMIDLRYNRPAKDDEICPFDVTDVEVEEIQQNPLDVNIAAIRKCDVCGKCDDPDPQINDGDAFDIPDIPDIDNVGNDFGRRKRQAAGQQPEASKLKCIRFSVSSKTENKEYGMSIVEFGLETGVEVMKEDLDKLKAEDQNINMYELPSNGKGFVVFYLLKITSSNITQFTFRLKDNYEGNVNTRQPSYVKVYDYYNPDQQCTKLYGTGPDRANGVSYRCDKDNKQCQCLQSLCAKPVDDEILRLYSQGKPVQKLVMYTCNPEKANYAVFVKIENVTYVVGKEEMVARGVILRSIHKGIQKLEKDNQMVLFWKMSCDPKILEEGKQYYIIGKDGFKLGDREEFRYPLMGTTLIIKNLDGKVKLVMGVYTKILADKGCQSK